MLQNRSVSRGIRDVRNRFVIVNKRRKLIYPESVLELKPLFPQGWDDPAVTLPVNSINKVAFVFFWVKDERFG